MAILKKHVKKYNSVSRFICYEGIKLLKSYNWPGNVREMENLLERVVLLCENKIITDKDILPMLPISDENEPTQVSQKEITTNQINDIDQDVIDNIDSKVKEWQSKSSYDGNYFEWKAKK